ncbi:MAG: cell wall-binding repeat-containing protein, partial [Finegoldia magna]|nr:cell wall-binding repeat-containing protein [Finegoldia magna]
MKKLVALMLACMLSFPVVSVADKDSANEGASEKVEANANDTAKKSDSNAKTKDTNEKKQEEITTNEDGVFKNVIHQRFQGENRAKTAVNVQRHYFANTNKVILVNDNAYPDAISATNVSM